MWTEAQVTARGTKTLLASVVRRLLKNCNKSMAIIEYSTRRYRFKLRGVLDKDDDDLEPAVAVILHRWSGVQITNRKRSCDQLKGDSMPLQCMATTAARLSYRAC